MFNYPFIKFYFIFSVLLLTIQYSYSSLPDSLRKTTPRIDSSLVFYFSNNFEKSGELKLVPYDTTVTGTQNYDPLFSRSRFFATLGNIGSATENLVPYPIFRQSGFDFGIHTFDPYLFMNDSVKYYKVIKTFSDIHYSQGAKKEIFFHAIFTRNIYHSLNLGFDFRVFNSPGAYQMQRTNAINFYITAQYFSRNKRYGVISNFILNRIRNNENGGIKYDTLFTQNLESNRQIYSVNLNHAENRVKDIGFFMKHYFDLTRHSRNNKDTTFQKGERVDLGRLTYSFFYNRQVQNYIDYQANSGFYPAIYLDSLQTYDSVTITRVVNEITWTNPSFRQDKKARVLQLEAHFKHLYHEVSYHGIKKFVRQYMPVVEISIHPYSSLTLYGYGDYVFGDYNQGDLSLNVSLTQTLGTPQHNLGSISIKGYSCFQQPGWFYEHWFGNNFKWDTSWKKQNIIAGGFSYTFKTLDAGVNISRITNFVYLDTAVKPRQNTSQFGYIYAYLNGEIGFWRFKLKGQFAYQTIQGSNVLRVPSFLGNLAVYYTQQLFHGAATFQPGVSVYYNTFYYGNSYMPAIRSFYLQDTRQTGNYPYMDVFINLKIQRARIFVMYSHFNASFMGRTYFMVPDYPMQDAAFRFGVSWNFHD